MRVQDGTRTVRSCGSYWDVTDKGRRVAPVDQGSGRGTSYVLKIIDPVKDKGW